MKSINDRDFGDLLETAIKMFDEGSRQTREPTPERQRKRDSENLRLTLNAMLKGWSEEDQTDIRPHLRRELQYHIRGLRTQERFVALEATKKQEAERQLPLFTMTPPGKR